MRSNLPDQSLAGFGIEGFKVLDPVRTVVESLSGDEEGGGVNWHD